MINMYEIVKMPRPINETSEKFKPLKDALNKLDIGQSLIVNTDKERKSVFMYARRKLGFIFVTQKMPDGRFQIYRDA